MLLPDDLVRMADTGVIVIVGTRDADGVPEVSRGWGVRVLSDCDALEICVSSRVCGRTLDNLADNQQIAVTITSPSNYRSFQVKGRAIETRSITPSDLERITRHQRAFTDEVVAVGMPQQSAVRLSSIEMEDAPEITSIRVLVEAVFTQTPGPGAGSRL
jgi:predicted pyridoxine 5'-phosphate oxidase superfamily flavin-nucleotide-binding protein